MIEALLDLDLQILEFINRHLHNFILDKLMVGATILGDNGLVWILIILALVVSKKYRMIGLMAGCALLLSWTLTDAILKHLIQRPRPFTAVPAISLLIDKPSSFSFPSGHTSSSVAAACILVPLLKKYRYYLIALALMIPLSRMYLFVHYPTDIFGGVVVGVFCALAARYIFRLVDRRFSAGLPPQL